MSTAAPDPQRPAGRSLSRRTVLVISLLGTVVAVAVAMLTASLLRPSGPSATGSVVIATATAVVGTAIETAPHAVLPPRVTLPSQRSATSQVGNGDLVYEVTGSGVTAIVVPDGQLLDRPNVPWKAVVPIQNQGDQSVLLIARIGPDGGSVTCRVVHRGATVVEDTKAGPNAQAICSRVVRR